MLRVKVGVVLTSHFPKLSGQPRWCPMALLSNGQIPTELLLLFPVKSCEGHGNASIPKFHITESLSDVSVGVEK